jgi:hypothetical protein
MARYSGGSFWRIILAHLLGGFSWPMKQAGFERKKKKSKKMRKEMYNQWICKLHHEHCI